MRGRQGRCAWRSSASTWTSTPPRSTLARRSPSSGTSRARTASAARAASRSRAWPSRSSPPVTEPSAPAHDGDRGRGAAACVPQRFATQVEARSPARSQTTRAGRVGDLLLGDPIRLPLPLRKRGKMSSPSVLPAARSAPARRNHVGTVSLVVAVGGAAACHLGLQGGPFASATWLRIVAAGFEAATVGGFADWFAVTALFRHPLGLPIPHTAIVATRKELIGRILGTFVQNHFLSREVIAANLRAVRPAERAARWLADPEHSRRIARQIAGGLAKTLEALPDEDVRVLNHEVVSARLRATRVAPALGNTLALVLADDRHQALLNEAVRLAAEAVRDNRDVIRDKVRTESPWWVPGAGGDQLFQRIIGNVESLKHLG